MAMQALLSRTCSFIANSQSFLNSRTVAAPMLLPTRNLKHDTVEKVKLLKIPEKPKKPPTPFFKFITEHRVKVAREHPTLKPTDIVKKLAEDWKSVSAELKEKYNVQYKSECEVYNQKILNFNAKLTSEQREVLGKVAEEKRSDKKKRKIRKIYKETHKPKRPVGPYACYLMEQSRVRNMPLKDLLASLKDEWANLPEDQKAKYQNQFKEEKKKYEAAMVEWEAKMIKEGKSDLIRVKSAIESRPSRISQLKKDSSK
ncbi:hypothetical protein NQ315_005827 [Exocentrus adspersus]|uniref:HMG box domain-containing protein n=1 Tax=Exocentrus adspersus TaxID=1586481 RepID=A0AAV8VSF0_9CUCU|nr:hypothetical protein NQ315_005827 [Exocentrus adspersus]